MDESTCTRLEQFWDDIDAKDTSLLDRVLACHVTKSHDDVAGPPSPLPARAACVPKISPELCDPVIKLGIDAADLFLRQSQIRRSVCLNSTNNLTNSKNLQNIKTIWAQQTRPHHHHDDDQYVH
jgi:hypothetical protein